MKEKIRTLFFVLKNKGLIFHIIHDFSNNFAGKLAFGDNCKIKKCRLIGEITLGNNCKVNESELMGNISVQGESYIESSILNGEISTGEGCRIYHSEIFSKTKLEIGRYSSLWGPNIAIRQSIYPVKIGSFCSIARNVNIQEYNHNSKKVSTYYMGSNVFKESWNNENVSKGSIEIGNDVWIGANSIVLTGTKIGNGCIIASNTVANKIYPDYAIIVGTPGKVIGYRFDQKTIEFLSELKWWDWSIEKIKTNKLLFQSEFNLKNIKLI